MSHGGDRDDSSAPHSRSAHYGMLVIVTVTNFQLVRPLMTIGDWHDKFKDRENAVYSTQQSMQ